jgi:hypothetical protein
MRLTFDLRDNPFDPELPSGRRLSGAPLRVHADPETKKLVCFSIAKMKDSEEDLRWAVFGDDKADGAPVQHNIILLILGVQGSGRSTLASLICERVLAAKQPGEGAWQQFERQFDKFRPIDPKEIEAEFTSLRTEFKTKFGSNAGQALVLIEDLPADSFDHVMSAFTAFPKVTRVFIVTSRDERLHERDLDAAGMIIQRVALPRLTAADVHNFIADRVPKYREGRQPLLKTDPELELFPFAANAPDAAVSGDSKPLQSVRVWLWNQLNAQHRQLVSRPGFTDVAAATRPELLARMIP